MPARSSSPRTMPSCSITPPDGVETDPERRPFVIIDPRAGHGPGIGGFKQDSQVGVALKAGHPVYFVIFFPRTGAWADPRGCLARRGGIPPHCR